MSLRGNLRNIMPPYRATTNLTFGSCKSAALIEGLFALGSKFLRRKQRLFDQQIEGLLFFGFLNDLFHRFDDIVQHLNLHQAFMVFDLLIILSIKLFLEQVYFPFLFFHVKFFPDGDF